MRLALCSGRSRFLASLPRRAPFSLGGSVAFSFDYARRLKGEKTALLVEAPFAAAPSHHGSDHR
jgi:hypothetical protein